MRNMLKIFVLMSSLYLVLFCPLTAQEVSQKKVLIFVIDQSGSMQRNNLYKKVKEDIKDFIGNSERSGIKFGDRLIIMGFGDDVKYHFDEELRGARDIERVKGEIERMNFKDQWTHMSKAFDILAKRIDEVHRTYPALKYIYIYTDGKNEPPPQLNESPIAFTEILKKYWQYKTLEEKDIYICLITFGIDTPSEVKKELPESDRVNYVKETTTPKEKEKITPEPVLPKPKPQPAPVKLKPVSSKKKISPLIWLIPGIIIVIAIVFGIKHITKESFPEDCFLVQTDEAGNEIRRFALIKYGKSVSPKNLEISELTSSAFSIFIRKGIIYLQAGEGEEIEITGEGSKKLEKGESVTLFSDTGFKCGSLYFKFIREGQNI